MIEDFSPERLAAQAQMRAALHWYARAIDRGQSPLMAQAFHTDATVDCGALKGSIADFCAMLDERKRQVPCAVHMLGNMLVDFVDDTRAFMESYCLALEEFLPEAPGEPSLNRLVRVRYADDFECRDGLWKITHHLIVVDHVMPAEPAAIPDGFFNGPRGLRNSDDPILQRRVALGF